MPLKAPAPAVVAYNWTGFYAGLNAGGSAASQDFDYTGPFAAFSRYAGDVSFVGGGQVGYNWQTGPWLLGLEADIAWRENRANEAYVRPSALVVAGAPFNTFAGDTALFHSEQNWIGTLRGRIGWTWANMMFYGTGGAAYGDVKHSVFEFLVAPNSNNNRGLSISETKWGWTAGFGTEAAFGKWTVGFEYLYVDLGDSTVAFATTVPGPGAFAFPADSTRFDNISHLVRAKVNYRF